MSLQELGASVAVLEAHRQNHAADLARVTGHVTKLEERMTAAEKQAINLESVVRTTGRNVTWGLSFVIAVVTLVVKLVWG